jgi:hypothetical protein
MTIEWPRNICIFRIKSAGVPEQIGHPNGANQATVTE